MRTTYYDDIRKYFVVYVREPYRKRNAWTLSMDEYTFAKRHRIKNIIFKHKRTGQEWIVVTDSIDFCDSEFLKYNGETELRIIVPITDSLV